MQIRSGCLVAGRSRLPTFTHDPIISPPIRASTVYTPKRSLVYLLIFVVLLGAIHPVAAQGGTPTLAYGQTVTGKITNDAFRLVYTFPGRQGDIIDAVLTRTDGTLDPTLILLGDQNDLIARDDDSGPGYSAIIQSQRLPREGVYFLIATRFGQERGMTVGGFTLTLSWIGITGEAGASLQYGDNVVGEITDAQPQQIYAFRAVRGDIVSMALKRISGNLDPYLILADPQGTAMLVGDDDPQSPGTLDAAIRDVRIRKTGNYILVATRFGREAGSTVGGFTLTLDRLPSDQMGKTPDTAILIDYGSTTNDTIDSDTVMRFYLIEMRQGDVVTINIERTKGNLDPTLTLYNSKLKELAEHDTGQRGQNARITTFNVLLSGDYILMVSRFNRDKGITAGNYSLTISARGK